MGADAEIAYDAHCHIHETPESYAALAQHKHIVYCVQGTNYADWQAVVELKTQHGDRIIPAFGVHPWFAGRVESGEIPADWQTRLRRLVTQHGGIVGECGLDKAARSPATGEAYPLEPQLAVLRAQLDIACELGVGVSVHCVRAFGALADALRQAGRCGRLPPRIMLHSYGGSADMLAQVFFKGEVGKRMFVSFSRAVNGRSAKRAAQCMQAAPESRILAESDLHDAAATAGALDAITALIAEARGWSEDEARERLAANARRFFIAGGEEHL
ncbi:Cut9-interacting protein scn1 [Kickxella alabastrina]|uniref:Cut9-interacting protein scn1 n=1 Tax=Kickxella alabastrina TaxID=61397 RepID=A0ACC1IIY0_9FUNG|nr:Cut9-interacting protein scn1 [Kickxella alabastrina]